jgi:hypothetical protein
LRHASTARFGELPETGGAFPGPADSPHSRATNPAVRVLAGLSTNPSSGDPTAQQLVDAVVATLGVVEGYWLNVPAPGPYCPACNPQRPDLAVALLQLLRQRC